MALTPGTTLGVYEVLAAIGAGGMGEVYKARDTKLDRDVALKILPDAFVNDPERLARFEREAKVLASLNHPNIAQIYGLEEGGDSPALVLEYVPGPTLQDRIAKGPIPLDEALPIARQIAEALEAAHEQGIIHRDLKPANVKVKDDGTVKVLDFGLAKALGPELSDTEAANSPTMTMTAAATKMGVIMGTAAYMSPEQAAGKQVDRSADVWAFGVVLFEMLSGQQVFTGETVSHVLASVLKTDPDWTKLPSDTSAPLRKLLRRCLERHPKQRLRDIREARIDIDEATTAPLAATVVAAVPPTPFLGWPRSLSLGLGAVVLFATAAVGLWRLAGPDTRMTSENRQPVYLRLATPSDVSVTYQRLNPTVTISQQARQLVYVGSSSGEERLYVQDLGQAGSIAPIANTAEAANPFLSPDDEWVGFVANFKLQKVPLSGGESIELAEAPSMRGATWSPDGETIYFAPSVAGGIWKLPASGGDPEPVTTPDPDGSELGHAWPSVLPDGDRLLYTSDPQNLIMIVDLVTGRTTRLIEDGFFATYVSTGHLVFAQGSSLWAARFDLATLDVGPRFKVLENVVTGSELLADYAVSPSGTLVYLSGTSAFERTLVRMDRSGTPQRFGGDAHPHQSPISSSPDGRHLALTLFQAPGGGLRSNLSDLNVWVHDLARGTFDRLTNQPQGALAPVWSADGRNVAFASVTGNQINLYVRPTDKSEPAALLYASEYPKWPSSWSSDGETLAFQQEHPETGLDIWLYSMGRKNAREYRAGPFNEGFATFSPDGDWLAYHSDETGQFEIYVEPYPGPGRVCRVSTAGGEEPKWSRSGTELFYRQASTAMVADVADRDLCNSEPIALFDGLTEQAWAVLPTGDSFITLDPREPPELHVVLDWLNELQRLSGTN